MRLVDDLRVLVQKSGFRKLLGVRLVSQCADGMFQAGLASLFFFRPEAMADAAGVAAALVVLLLPYSLVGPFTGPFLDRWRRRQVLFIGNLVRAGLVFLVAAGMAMIGAGPLVYVLTLTSLGLSRFMLAGLSAGLPIVVGSRARLLMANSVVPTLGGIATGVGAVVGFLLRLLLPEGHRSNWHHLSSRHSSTSGRPAWRAFSTRTNSARSNRISRPLCRGNSRPRLGTWRRLYATWCGGEHQAWL
ncbi:hypothetical protein [Actinobaculum sp. 313]|uniref:hypothetical protein n=1 Tax=Actinobaculum sp. 313 TaxID=2495645 RepID=UPI003204B52B